MTKLLGNEKPDPSNAFKVVQLQTKAATQVVIRDRAGRKLFDLELPGISIAVAVSKDEEIAIEPQKGTHAHDA